MQLQHPEVHLFEGRTLHTNTRGHWRCAEVCSLAVCTDEQNASQWTVHAFFVCDCFVVSPTHCQITQCASSHPNPVLFAKVKHFCQHQVDFHGVEKLKVYFSFQFLLCASFLVRLMGYPLSNRPKSTLSSRGKSFWSSRNCRRRLCLCTFLNVEARGGMQRDAKWWNSSAVIMGISMGGGGFCSCFWICNAPLCCDQCCILAARHKNLRRDLQMVQHPRLNQVMCSRRVHRMRSKTRRMKKKRKLVKTFLVS